MTALGLGCAAQGNLFREHDDEEAQAVFEAAWQSGIRHFDTAPHYGLGLSEARLGRFLATKPRDEFVVSTKVGRLLRTNPRWDGVSRDDQGFVVPGNLHRTWDLSPSGVRASLEESLERMGLDRVDIAYLHDPEVSGVDDAAVTGMESLAVLREAGLVDRIGVGSMQVASLQACADTGLADLLMVAGRYTLLDQGVAPDVLATCERHGIGLVVAAVFHSGLLAERPRAGAMFNYAEVGPEVLARAEAIAEVCALHGVELPAAAMHYAWRDPRVQVVVVGAATPTHIDDAANRIAQTVPDELWTALAESGLVPDVLA